MSALFCRLQRRPATVPSSLAQLRNNRSRVRCFSDAGNADQRSSSKRTILWAVVGANVAVFASWSYAQARSDYGLQRTLCRHFLFSKQAIQEGRYWTAVTAAFSQRNPKHILFNMVTLWSFSSVLVASPLVSVGGYSALILGSAVASSAAWLYHSGLRNEPAGHGALGASGIVSGVGAAAAFLQPSARFLLMGVVPAPLWALVGGYALVDSYFLGANDNVGHSSHLGGFLFGAAFYLVGIRTGVRTRL